eukprot:m.58725 g.58725  ORF g.58725 m.58725 type:complete len:431 (+) comp11279_c0_seq3:409-1701(+)
MGNCNVVGPDEVMVISGGCCSNGRKIIQGGCGWSWWFCTDVQSLSLNVMTITPTCERVETQHGVSVTVTAVAQVKVMTSVDNEQELLGKALEQFLGKTRRDIHDAILQTLEGHLRAILGTLTVEEIYKDREKFAAQVLDTAERDMTKMGLQIVSFTIKDVFDHVDYLDSLGKEQTAVVIRNADVGIANADRDAGVQEALYEKQMMEKVNESKTAIANSRRAYETAKATFDEEVNTIQAEANLAYKLQAAKCKQKIREQEVEVEVVERTRMIEVQEKEVDRRNKELIAEVNRPAEAEKYRVETIAEANRTHDVLKAQGEAEGIKVIGASEAYAIQAIGEAKANAMTARADAFNSYGKAATTSLILQSLPKIAAEVAAPLARTKEIVVLSGDSSNVTGEVNKLVSQLPPAVQALTGVDLTKAMSGLVGNSSV